MAGKPLGYISNLRPLVKPALKWLKSGQSLGHERDLLRRAAFEIESTLALNPCR
jgi:hypothetical protein